MGRVPAMPFIFSQATRPVAAAMVTIPTKLATSRLQTRLDLINCPSRRKLRLIAVGIMMN